MTGDYSTEIVFGVVGAVGTDLEMVTTELKVALNDFNYETYEVRLSALLAELDWDAELPSQPSDAHIATHMDAGNRLRRTWGRGDALALLALAEIANVRAEKHEDGDPHVPIDRQAFVLRSLKHPEEIELLRSIYGSRFYLVSAYSPRSQREEALRAQCIRDYGSENQDDWSHTPKALIERDEAEPEPRDLPDTQRGMGQNVRDTFHRADFFLDASAATQLKIDAKRMIEIVFGHPFRTPTLEEYALFQAQGAARRSAEPGRQVGAAIVGRDGTVVALGSNEVPRAGGGTYWEERSGNNPDDDGREFQNDVDTNDQMKREIAQEIVGELIADGWVDETKATADPTALLDAIEQTRLGNLIEFGRAVHAEMDALLDAARRGASVQDGTLFTTTFPCHNCTRHIVAAGIRRVVYVAPYAKSLAKALHEDAIEVASRQPRQDAVQFEPFVGVAPRRYLDLFEAGKRKEDDGRIVEFIPSDAKPRIMDLEPDDLRPREERYTQREELALELLGEVMQGTGVALRQAEEET
jgi:cytidine deaminase